jgi:hypothetical protein
LRKNRMNSFVTKQQEIFYFGASKSTEGNNRLS